MPLSCISLLEHAKIRRCGIKTYSTLAKPKFDKILWYGIDIPHINHNAQFVARN
jgi:hypothetical protein